MEGGAVWHNFERNPPKDHHTHVWLNMVQWFQGKDLNVKVYDILWIDIGTLTDDRCQVMTKAYIAFGQVS